MPQPCTEPIPPPVDRDPPTVLPADAPLAERVALRIEDEVFARGWPVGELLGSESDLIERYAVSRAVLREAVRIVEHHNVAKMRRGPGGGLFVCPPNPSAVQRSMAVYLRSQHTTRQDLHQPRMSLELAALTETVERIDEPGILRLREALKFEEELGPDAVRLGHTHDLHVVIAELCGNPVMALFMRVLGQLDEAMTYAAERYPIDDSMAAAESHRAHVRIVEAITVGDASLAVHRMRRHLIAIRDFLSTSTAAAARPGPTGGSR